MYHVKHAFGNMWTAKAPWIRGGIHTLFFLFLHENTYCGYSLEVPQQGASNEYPQHMFSYRIKTILVLFGRNKAPYLMLWTLRRQTWIFTLCIYPEHTISHLAAQFVLNISTDRVYRASQSQYRQINK